MKPLLKILYLLYRSFSGLRYRAARRFTRAGLAVLIGLIAAAGMGVDTENTVAYQAFALLLGLLSAAVVSSAGFPVRFSARRLLPRFGSAGKAFRYTVVVENLTSKSQPGLTLLEELADPRPSFQDWAAVGFAEQKQFRSFRVGRRAVSSPFKRVIIKEAELPTLRPHEEGEIEVEVTPLRRGLLRFTGLTMARADPLGIFRAFSKISLPQSVLVLPRRYPVPPIALPGVMKYQQGGIALASNVGQSEEFVAVRDYRSGDPLRHIHWRSWARAGKPVVKEFEDEFFVRHALVLDTFIEHPYSEVFEEAVSVAASFACTIPTQESLLDLLFVGPESYCFTAGRGLAQADQMLEILGSVQACREHPFSTLEHLVLNHISAVSGCICVLVAWDRERRDFVEKLKVLNIPVQVLVITAPEEAEPLDPGPMRDEPTRFHVLKAGKIKEGLANLA